MINEITIRKLVDCILLNACSVNSSGLYNGKAGMSLALFEAARFLHDEKIEDKAFDLFQECLVRPTNDYSFENGLSGVGYTLIYLIINKFIDADFEEVFKEHCEKIIYDFDSIDKHPDKLLISLKAIYFLSVLKSVHYEDIRVNQIIEKIFQGTELYLSLQFFDWKNMYYINRKADVLKTYETYLKLIDFAEYANFSDYLMNSYAELYRSGRIASSLSTGYYLCNIMKQNNVTQYRDVINSNISYGLKDIHPNLLSLEQKINLTKIIENINTSYGDYRLMGIDFWGENFEKIKSSVRPNHLHYGYQYGLVRYLIYSINKRAILL
ncbi:MAG: hypothetical protein PHQ11_00945 [Paludibacter sp.]|nr:hypothetical protein [Paludibacter sp.]MDD4198398.1 hypothetical protein [Paludibacter sp.]MDD4427076.1 hypothetical protein [Paludibacter sp.]